MLVGRSIDSRESELSRRWLQRAGQHTRAHGAQGEDARAGERSGPYDPGGVGWVLERYQQTLDGSFSTVSKPNFGRKNSLESS